jgi:hypothetical protein
MRFVGEMAWRLPWVIDTEHLVTFTGSGRLLVWDSAEV